MIYARCATPALRSVLQLLIESTHPEAAALCKAYRCAESSRRFHRTVQKWHPEDVIWAKDMERADAAKASEAEAALHIHLTERGEIAATVSQLIADISDAIIKEQLWYYGRAKAEITEWFRPGMTHSDFAKNMSGGPLNPSYELALEIWQEACPNMTLKEVYYYFDREIDYVLPDHLAKA